MWCNQSYHCSSQVWAPLKLFNLWHIWIFAKSNLLPCLQTALLKHLPRSYFNFLNYLEDALLLCVFPLLGCLLFMSLSWLSCVYIYIFLYMHIYTHTCFFLLLHSSQRNLSLMSICLMFDCINHLTIYSSVSQGLIWNRWQLFLTLADEGPLLLKYLG
mgnify:CR=1 FL=1